jgi:5-methyltetrahydrofolate--homocysteine methyltransferase
MFDYQEIGNALIACNQAKVMELVDTALKNGNPPDEVLNQGLIAGMDVVGEKMQSGEMFIPEVLMAAKVMTAALDVLKPLLGDAGLKSRGSVIIGTVKGDLHDIGKNLVAMMFKSAGLQVFDEGVDVSPEAFIEKIKAEQPDILCLSALLTTTMPMLQATIAAVQESGLRENLKIMVGGAPVTKEYANDVGADGYADDAGSAVKMAKSLIA